MSEFTNLEKDSISRNRIVSEINTNFFVEAGAGSGKTTMLVSRMVAMVEAGIPIDRICAITFTRAAANEFYERFQRLLIERSNPEYRWKDKGYAGQLPKPTKETINRCAEALKNIDLCFMGTIDAFCSMVLSEHPSEAHIPSDAGVISDQEAESLYKQQYVKICDGDYGKELAELSGEFRAFYYNAEEVFVQGVKVLMDNRNVHFNFELPEAVDIDKDFAGVRKDLVDAVKCLSEHPELKYTGNKDSVAAWETIDDIYKNISRKWSYNYSGVVSALNKLVKVRVVPEAANHYGASLAGVFELGGKSRKWLECNVDKEGGILPKLTSLQYSATMAFLSSCVPHLEEALREKGKMSFFDCLHFLRNMLKQDAEKEGKLIKYIYDRHSFFLVDEFQDTNPMQAEVLFYLTSENPVPQWSACVPRPGSLFIVGDPKQSIYRFRGADVTSFLRVKGLFEEYGGDILSLSRNFRSTKTLCEYFNDSFSGLLPEETVDQSKFEDIPLPEERPGEFQGIFTYTAYTGKLASEYPDETDPEQIKKVIKKLVGNKDYLIKTKTDKEPREIRYKDFMIITYGKSKLGPIVKDLNDAGIPTRVEGKVLFGENEVLLEVRKIYSAVADPDDQIALYGALTGKLIGLTKEEILAFRKEGGSVSFYSSFDVEQSSDKNAQYVASCVDKLKKLYYKAQRLSPAALLEKIIDDYRVYKTIKADNMEVVYYTLELMRDAEKSGAVITLKDGTAYLDQLMSEFSDKERCLSLNDDRDAVHMANLHKVKGLEAPIVILSASTMFNDSVSTRIVHGDDGSEGYYFNLPIPGKYNAYYFKTDSYKDEEDIEKASSKAEDLRLIYVAATRARNALIISNSIVASWSNICYKSIWEPLMQVGTYDFFEFTGETDENEEVEVASVDSGKLYNEAEQSSVLNNRSVENSTYMVVNPSRLHLSSKISEQQSVNVDEEQPVNVVTEQKVQSDNDINNRFPALLGTMVHKLMEMIVSSAKKVDISMIVDEIIREYRTPVFEQYELDLKKALINVAKQMRDGGYPQTNDLAQNMLETLLKAEKVYCEVPFCYAEDGENGKVVWNGIMDVVYKSADGWHIVDYKTNADGSDLDKRYQAQLEAYVKAFKETTGEDADAKAYHIDI